MATANPANAQNNTPKWAAYGANGAIDRIEAVDVDDVGNVYGAGTMGNNLLFQGKGPIPTYNGTQDAFIAQFDNTTGALTNLFHIEGSGKESVHDIRVTNKGEIFIVGTFSDTLYYNGTSLFTSIGETDAFVAKFNQTGALLWATHIASSQNDIIHAIDIAPQPHNEIAITGSFEGNILYLDGDPILSAQCTGKNIFVIRLQQQSGSITMNRTIGPPTTCIDIEGYGIAIDSTLNLYVVGRFNGHDIDFDPNGNQKLLSSEQEDGFVWKLDHKGNYQWAARIGGGAIGNVRTGAEDRVYDVALSPNHQTLWIAGVFRAQHLLWEQPGSPSTVHIFHHTWNPIPWPWDLDGFAIQLNTTDGTPKAQSQIGGEGQGGLDDTLPVAITTDRWGNHYWTATFHGQINVDWPGSNNPYLPNNGWTSANANHEMIIRKWNDSLQWVEWYETSQTNFPPSSVYGTKGLDVTVDGCENVFIGGAFDHTTTFHGLTISSGTLFDPYLYKIEQHSCPQCTLVTACGEYVLPLLDDTVSQSGFYYDYRQPVSCIDTTIIALTIFPTASLNWPHGDTVCTGYYYAFNPTPSGGTLHADPPTAVTSNPPHNYGLEFLPLQHGQLVVFYYEYPNDYGCPQRDYDTVLVDSTAKCPTLRLRSSKALTTETEKWVTSVNREGVQITLPKLESPQMEGTIRVYDLVGRLQFEQTGPPHLIRIPLSRGTYIIELQKGNYIQRKRVVIY